MLLVLALVASLALFAAGDKAATTGTAPARASNAPFGPIVDRVVYEVRMDQTIATKDIIEGNADVFFQAVPPVILRGLSQADRDKLEMYTVPSGSWSLAINNIPNRAPYTWTKEGTTTFNPLAIREVRYAMNWLFNRQKLIDEILLGAGDPMFTGMTPGQPGTYRYNLIPAKMGMTPQGDERRAIAEITAAIQAAANLPENRGRLVRPAGGRFWQFDGKDVTIKFLIRVDDVTGRLPAGRYYADQLEKAGIKVERLERDRTAIQIAYYSNPADLEWHMYTEGWGAGATRAWWDIIISQMYSPYYGYMPGGADPANWNYENAELDTLGQKGLNGQFLTEAEYWRDNLHAMEVALRESVRIYITSQLDSFVANKARFNTRMAYGLGDGLNGWSVRTADVRPGADGKKTLRVLQFSARGALFMSAWDVVGTDGFSDVYAAAIIEPVSDTATFAAPNSAAVTPLRTRFDPSTLRNDVVLGADGALQGRVPVPATAVLYDSVSKTWKPIGAGQTSFSAISTTYLYGKWHSGVDITFADLAYATAFGYEWIHQDGDSDRFYDASFAAQVEPGLAIYKGYVFNADGSITAYYDFNFPMEIEQVAGSGALSPKAGNPGRSTVVCWDIYEAVALLVAEGSASGKVYGFTPGEGVSDPDVKDPDSLADIKAKLEDMKRRQYVPASIRQWVTPAQAVARYDASLRFINTYGHAYISNGPFMISKIDTRNNSCELTAFRDYLYRADFWPQQFAMNLTQVDEVVVPATATTRANVVITVNASSYVYPSATMVPLSRDGKVTVGLQKPDGTEKIYVAAFRAPGQFVATIPAADLAALGAGSYTLVVISTFDKGEAPSVVPTTLVLQ
ncbi:MAG TPA: ABC transporter substrate-binding protein [Spirochaetaceae bacterium]|nr:ABC transporter substrate-binding protein [Spirochaetaceae bacterium]HAW84782.1 ABC transporter substrate-binding protein [Spirochaetaceae bacterium]HAX36738.1 ABC transporter substrate-binding protein [Spirochaetaceae bacterium]HBO41860.1 ABC transporter substrate-binding protein [Spirochaetaceae bacterium]HCQ87615.1 ABC transporter substrate-binding protein [Spirochaetaceae bacterium]